MGGVETKAASANESETRFTFVDKSRSRGLLARIGQAILPTKADPRDINLIPGEERATSYRPSNYLISFFVMVVLPAIAAAVYFGFLASDQYAAETRFAVKSAAGDTFSSDKSKSFSLTGGVAAASDDAYLIAAYVRSRACIDEISKTIDLRETFRRPEADFWARLEPDASPEDLLKYWRKMVDSYVDPLSGIVTVTVSAFRRDDALAVASAVLKASEKVANEVSTRARDDIMKLAQDETTRSEDRVVASLSDLREFRQRAGFIDPVMQAESAGKLLEELIAQRIRLETNYIVSSRAMSPEAPTLQAVKSRLDELDLQIAQEKAKLTSESKGSGALSGMLPKYEELKVRNEFAEKLYDAAAEALERARLRALAQTIYVNVFVPPALPQEALYPERFASSAVISFVLFILWGICGLTAALIEDHKL